MKRPIPALAGWSQQNATVNGPSQRLVILQNRSSHRNDDRSHDRSTTVKPDQITSYAHTANRHGLLTDSPIVDKENDCLGFLDLSTLIAKRIKEHPCADPSDDRKCDLRSIDTFGLYGSWGTGKSSLLALTRAQCREDVIWIDFDALKYQTEEMILVPLLHHIAEECGDEEAARFFFGLVKNLGIFAANVIIAASGVPFKDQAAKLVDKVQNIATTELSPDAKLPKSRARAVEDAFGDLSRLLRKKRSRKRIIVAIDNLDRCRPPALLELLEAIHILLETDDVTFIVAMDQAACVRCIAKQYGFLISEAALYLEKMIPDYFRVPDPWVVETYQEAQAGEDAILKYLRYLLQDYLCEPLRPHEKLLWAVIGSTTILRNPRRSKRLLRRLAAFSDRWWKAHSEQFLASLFLCAVSDIWPGLYAAIPVTEPGDWKKFITCVEENKASGTAIDDLVDPPFFQFIFVLRSCKKEGAGFSVIRNYSSIDVLLGEMRTLGL